MYRLMHVAIGVCVCVCVCVFVCVPERRQTGKIKSTGNSMCSVDYTYIDGQLPQRKKQSVK